MKTNYTLFASRVRLLRSRGPLVILFLLLCFTAFAQKRTVSGTVKDSEGELLPGATVLESGTSNGVVTDLEGAFNIEVDQNASLEISYVGFDPIIVNVAGRTNFDFTLKLSLALFEEVVVIGYVESRSRDVTGAITKVSADDFNVGLISTPDQLFTGKVTGIQVTPTGGQPGANSVIAIRGIGTLSGSTSPLYVVDGFPLDDVNPLPQGITFDPLGQSPA